MTRTEIEGLVFIGALAILFAFGYFVYNSSPKTDIKEDNHTVTTIVTVKKPNGTVTTTEKIDSKTKTNTVIVPPKTGKINISVLVTNDFSKRSLQPAYGMSISREILGPITVGAFGLTTGVVGVSIGINF